MICPPGVNPALWGQISSRCDAYDLRREAERQAEEMWAFITSEAERGNYRARALMDEFRLRPTSPP